MTDKHRKGSSAIDDFFDAIMSEASVEELLSIITRIDDPDHLYEIMMEVAGDHPDDVRIYNAASDKRKMLTSNLGSRKGSCGNCERPENLSNISASIVSGFKRSIGEPTRTGGAPAFATGNSGKLMSDVKGFINNDTVSTKLQKTFGTTDQRNQAILKEHANKQAKIDRQNKVDQLRNGSRKGSIPRDILTTIENSVKIDGIGYDFTSTRNILESQGYNEFEIDEFVDEYMNNVVQ